jgi:steroid 5-alpha reductase family enzyme
LVMSALLIRYSGAGLLERTITRRRPGYEEYIRTTNAFFPGKPRTP